MESIHGHNVLELVKEQDVALTREALLNAIIQQFGEAACYHTCSARDLTAEQLIDQFVQKGKLVEVEGNIHYRGCSCHCH